MQILWVLVMVEGNSSVFGKDIYNIEGYKLSSPQEGSKILSISIPSMVNFGFTAMIIYSLATM